MNIISYDPVWCVSPPTDTTLLLNTQWRSVAAVVSVDTVSGAVTPLSPVDDTPDPLAANGALVCCVFFCVCRAATLLVLARSCQAPLL